MGCASSKASNEEAETVKLPNGKIVPEHTGARSFLEARGGVMASSGASAAVL